MISEVMFTNMDGPKNISPVVVWGHLNREITPSPLNHPLPTSPILTFLSPLHLHPLHHPFSLSPPDPLIEDRDH